MTACEKVLGDFFQLEPGPSYANEIVHVATRVTLDTTINSAQRNVEYLLTGADEKIWKF